MATSVDPPIVAAPARPEREAELPVTLIGGSARRGVVGWAELWRFRELGFFLAWRDVKVRYKQSVLGVAWAVIQPLGMMLAFALFFGRMGGAAAGVEHYPLFVLGAILPWTFFANSVSSAGNSLVANQHLVTKVYFPRLFIPLSQVGVALFDLLIGLGLLAVAAAVYGVPPSLGWLLALPILGLLCLAALGIGAGLAAVIAWQRDLRHALPFAVQMWMFATPSIYLPSSAFGEAASRYLPLNPAFGLAGGFRDAVLGLPIDGYSVGVSGAVAVVLCYAGLRVFRDAERKLADVI